MLTMHAYRLEQKEIDSLKYVSMFLCSHYTMWLLELDWSRMYKTMAADMVLIIVYTNVSQVGLGRC